MFRDRHHAGQVLAAALKKLKMHDPVVLALPRGGVPVAAEIAETLHAPLDLAIVRKIGAPDNPELAVAAIVDGDPPHVVVNRDIVEALRLDETELAIMAERERPELERRRRVYLGGRRREPIAGTTVILVDDGAATGASMRAVIHAAKTLSASKILVALPVAPIETVHEFAREVDQVICIEQPRYFRAIGDHYLDFRQLSDEDVIASLQQASRPQPNSL